MMLQGVRSTSLRLALPRNLHGQVFVLFIVAIAACEAGLALAMILTLYRRGKSLDSSDWQSLREEGMPQSVDVDPLPRYEPEPEPARLPPAGIRPTPEEAPRV